MKLDFVNFSALFIITMSIWFVKVQIDTSAKMVLLNSVTLPSTISLSEPQPAVQVNGFADSEAWGRWSIAKSPSIILNAAFPETLKVTLKAQAFGPNVGENIEILCGVTSTKIILAPQEKPVDFLC
ncbi:MAG: hypothetical protein QNL04_10350, partial [SAR324 cluster bacterium]|nr:hypothetical protein [SAR324 cluster bacterium]